MSDSSPAVRKRKWDLDDSGNTAPPPPPPPAHLSSLTPPPSRDNGSDDKSTDAAVAAAAKINAMLAAKGVALSKSSDSIKLALPRKEEAKKDLGGAEFEKDIDINDLKNRYMLTKGSTQKEIQAETGASITTRGMYYANRDDATEKDPPLYLHIAANDQESLDKATKRVNELLEIAKAGGQPQQRNVESPASTSEEAGHPHPPVPFNRNNPNMTPLSDRSERDDHDSRQNNRDFRGGLRPGQIDCRVFVGLEVDRCFNVRAKLVGPAGAYVKHIQQETGARVQIKGKGSGFVEPATGREADENLHIHIIHTQEGPLEAAKELCENLVQTVREEFEKQQSRFQPRQQGPPGGYGQHNQQRPQMAPGGYGPAPGMGGYDQSHGSGYQDPNYGYPGQQPGPPPPSSAPPPPPPGHGASSQQYQPPPPAGPSTQPPPPPPSSTQATTTTAASATKSGEWDLAAYTAYYSQMYPNHPDYALYYAQQAMAQQQQAAAGQTTAAAAAATPQTQQQQQDWAAYYAYYGYPTIQTALQTPAAPATSTTPGSVATGSPPMASASPTPQSATPSGNYRAVPPPPNL